MRRRSRYNAPLSAGLLLTAAASVVGKANYNQPLDRPFTLRNAEPLIMEREYGRLLRSDGPLTFILPRPCFSTHDSSRVCGEPHGFSYADSLNGGEISFSPRIGYEFRYIEESVHAMEGGLLATGASGPLSFYMDTRMFTELHEEFGHTSYDREFLEKQDRSASGTVAYVSYSRFRANLAYDHSWGRIAAGKDAIHWGPGLYNNLVFNQDAIPFRNMTYSASIGPFSVISLYGSLTPNRNWESDKSNSTRSIYAHRYEWRIGGDWLLGISEQLVLHDAEAPFAFLPVVPLFIAKAEEKEALNNGNISIDLSWRFRKKFRIYSEFFVDDMQSPTSLFNDSWGNKWAWMVGGHLIWDLGRLHGGSVAEYSRLEPWVYTHYERNTAQTAHWDFPLGNQAGPNSQTFTAKTYLIGPSNFTLSFRLDLRWKGIDAGSQINDEFFSEPRTSKTFLHGIGSPVVLARPSLSYFWKQWSLSGWLEMGTTQAGAISGSFLY